MFQTPTDNRSFTVFSLLHACHIFEICFIIKISFALSSDLLFIYLVQYTTTVQATEFKMNEELSSFKVAAEVAQVSR
jgi:hypothetical protein